MKARQDKAEKIPVWGKKYSETEGERKEEEEL